MTRRKIEFSELETERLKAVVGELEAILDTRRKSGSKKYTFEAMYGLVGTLENARSRPSNTRLLSFDELMILCDYLDCSIPERNRVLEKAQYEPILRFVDGEELKVALEVAQEVMAYIPMPAYVITQDWHVQYWNNYILRLFGLTDAQAKALKLNGRLSVLHFIFDHNLGLRQYLAGEDGTWEEMAFRNVYTFKTANWLYRYDPWYLLELEKLMKLPDFEHYFEQAQVDVAHPRLKAEFISQIKYPNNTTFRFRSLFIVNGSFYYPQVAAYMPIGEESIEVMRSLGVPVITAAH